MKNIDLLNLLKDYATAYRMIAPNSILWNTHMNDCEIGANIEQKHVDAILVDFINYIGSCNCVDYALYTSDIKKDK